ncbi:MAG: SAF domain-containing protein [Frankia sp.]
MTDLFPSPVRPTAGAPPSPPAQRLTRKRWRDSRLLIGILLVLVSVVLGARLFAAADRTQTWVTARHDLPAGHVLTRADLGEVKANLTGRTANLYYPSGRAPDLVGGTLARPVSGGDLLSGSSFAQSRQNPTRVVPVIVNAGRAPTLRAGDKVDVYVFQRAASGTAAATAGGATGGGSAASGAETLVLHDVEYLGEDDLSNGDRSLSLRVSVNAAIAAVAASQSNRVDVTRIDGSAVGGGPTSAPGYGS